MEKLNNLVESLYPQYGAPGSRDIDVTARRKAIDESATVIAEEFQELEQRAEAAEAELVTAKRAIDNLDAERGALRSELAALRGAAVPVHQVLLDDAWVDVSFGAMESQKKHGIETRILFTHPAPPVVNLNHVGRVTVQVSGQRYTYLSSEDIRHYFEEMKCQIVERKNPDFDTVYVPQTTPFVVLPELHYGVVQQDKVVMLPAADGQWLNKTAVCEALRDAGITVKSADGEG